MLSCPVFSDVSEKEAGWLGFYAITVGCVAAVLFGRYFMIVICLIENNVRDEE